MTNTKNTRRRKVLLTIAVLCVLVGLIALGSFAAFTATTTNTGNTTGLDGKPTAGVWNTNDSVDYRFTITQNDDTTANAHTSVATSGAHTFTWEARNN